MMARTFTSSDPILAKGPDVLVDRACNAAHHMDPLFFKQLDRLHPHSPGKYIGNSTGRKEPGKFPWFMAGIQDDLVMKNLSVSDMVDRKFFTMTKM